MCRSSTSRRMRRTKILSKLDRAPWMQNAIAPLAALATVTVQSTRASRIYEGPTPSLSLRGNDCSNKDVILPRR